MRLPISRRSVSSWVSPGPRKPIPPRCRSRWVQPRTSRVDKCVSCAISTCSLPSKERARCAKISRITPLRSSTRQQRSRSRLRSCAGERLRSKSTTSALYCATAALSSIALPTPTKYLGSGLARRADTVSTGTTPAEQTSSWNSAASPGRAGGGSSTLTRTARSPPGGRSNKRQGLVQRSIPRLPAHHPRAAISHCARAPRWRWHAYKPSGLPRS